MEPAQKSRFKIFLWDQFIRPFYLLLNIHQLQALLIALIIVNFVVWKNLYVFWIPSILLLLMFVYQIYKYYQSGEFIHNYRKYKSERGEYGDYRKLTKVLKNDNKPTKEELGKAFKNVCENIAEQNPDWQMNEMGEENIIGKDKFAKTGIVLDEKSLQEARNE